jgi:type II secretory pathway pseudopilin PulG
MSTGLIIAIVVVALILLALLFFIPRMREKARVQKRERELEQRRDRVAGEHREHATAREREAQQAEQKARLAQKEAESQRAEAELHQERASTYESGMADHELVDENERGKFAGTSADSPAGTRGDDGAMDRDRDRDGQETTASSRDADDGRGTTSGADGSDGDQRGERFTRDRNGATAAGQSDSEFERGREVGHEEESRRN